MMKPIDLNEAAEVIIRDLCGWCDSRFADAYMELAYADDKALEELPIEIDKSSMQLIIATIISKYTDTIPELVACKFFSKQEMQAYSMLYNIPVNIELFELASLHKKPVTNFGVAVTVVVAVMEGGAEAPKYQEAYEWLTEKGDDVPEEIRTAMTASLDKQLASLGVNVTYNDAGEPLYDKDEIIEALS